jgi:hypothetical protein
MNCDYVLWRPAGLSLQPTAVIRALEIILSEDSNIKPKNLKMDETIGIGRTSSVELQQLSN